MSRLRLTLVAVVLLSLRAGFFAQAPDVGPFTFRSIASGPVISSPIGIAVDPSGTAFVSSVRSSGLTPGVRAISPSGIVSTVTTLSADPRGITADPLGNIYVSTFSAQQIIKITPLGVSSVYVAQTPAPVTDLIVAADGSGYALTTSAVYTMAATGSMTLLAGAPSELGYTDGTGAAARFRGASGMALGADGHILVADRANDVIRRVTTGGVVTTVAGSGVEGGNDGTGPGAQFRDPSGIAVGSDGVAFIADSGNDLIRRMTSDGVVTTIAGEAGHPTGFVDGTGSAARFSRPYDLAFDATGALLVVDRDNNAVRRVTTAGVTTTLAPGAGTDPPTQAAFNAPEGIAVGPDGRVMVADTMNHVLKRVTATPTASVVQAVAGSAANGAGAVDESGVALEPGGVVVNSAGTVLVVDVSRFRILARSTSGVVTTYAGREGVSAWRDGPAGTATLLRPGAMAIDASDNLYLVDDGAIRRVTSDGAITTIAGVPGEGGQVDATGSAARFERISAIATDPSGNVWVMDSGTLRRITPAGAVTTVAGVPVSGGTFVAAVDGTGTAARLGSSRGLGVDSVGTLFIADSDNHVIRRATPAGEVTTIAGLIGTQFPPLVDGVGTDARFSGPRSLSVASDGEMFVSDWGSSAIRKVLPNGTVTTVVTGLRASAIWARADDSLLVSDQATDDVVQVAVGGAVTPFFGGAGTGRLNTPTGVAIDASGTTYVADTGSHTIRKRTAAGVLTTLVGAGAGLASPHGIAVHGTTLYVADTANHVIRQITDAGVVTTWAGTVGASGSTDGTTTAARFQLPRGVAARSDGTLYVADTANHVIRQITPAGEVSTFAGVAGSSGSADGSGAAARFSSPAGLAVDAAGVVYVADTGNHTIRAITSAGEVTTIGGVAGVPGNTDASGTTARFTAPSAIAVGADGVLYIADTSNYVIRLGYSGSLSVPVITTQPASQAVNQGQSVTFTVVASGEPGLFYQWQRKISSVAYSDIAGAERASYAVADAGTYRVVVSNLAGTATSADAMLAAHTLTASPSVLWFGGRTAPSGGPILELSPAQAVTVTFAGSGTPAWTATSRVPWIQVTGGSGTGGGQFTVALVGDPSSMENAGTGISVIDLDAPALGLSTQLEVFLRIVQDDAPPVGVMDTPANNATNLAGSVAVTGWAVDRLDLRKVEIWRNCVESIDRPLGACVSPAPGVADTFVFVGRATFVPGSRPDLMEPLTFVKTYPFVYEAGWGYLLLTNAFPHIPNGTPQGGQGTFTLSAYAVDSINQYTLLENSPRTITLNNDGATVPFGAVDTPEQGATIPGAAAPYNNAAAYPVFGWAMTQSGRCIDTSSTASYRMFVDGVSRPLIAGVNWFAGMSRPDVAAAYPGLCNTNDAVAAYYLDTRTLANGLHTLGWDVIDNDGQAAGIGSRFFTVLNSGADAPRRGMPDALASVSALAALSTNRTRALRASVGSVDTSVALRADADGVYRVRLPQTGRLAVDLDGPVTLGYQRLHAGLMELPGGSALDAKAGRFFWQPPIGFLGAFHLVFVTGTERVDVEVTIVDSTAGGGETVVTITSPRAGANPNPVITVAGTARDPRALTGTGIDAVHVWAYRRDIAGVPPQFLGAATLNGDAYTLTTKPLQPGTYDLAVFAWVARTGTWAPAATVNIAVR